MEGGEKNGKMLIGGGGRVKTKGGKGEREDERRMTEQRRMGRKRLAKERIEKKNDRKTTKLR